MLSTGFISMAIVNGVDRQEGDPYKGYIYTIYILYIYYIHLSSETQHFAFDAFL